MSSETPEDKKRVEEALKDSAKLKELVEALSDGSRRGRQQAAKVIAGVAAENPEILVPFASDLVDALERSEAQTRWECLDALTYVVSFDSRPCDKAIPGAEAALFDEDSGPFVWPHAAFCEAWVRRPRNARKKYGLSSTRASSAITAIWNSRICFWRSSTSPRGSWTGL